MSMSHSETTRQPSSYLPVFLLLGVALLGRLLPHPPNFTPLGAIALFGAAVLGHRFLAVLLPFAALYLSDLVLNNTLYAAYHEGFFWGVNWSVYLGFAVIIGLGFLALRGRELAPKRLAVTAIGASGLFFLITNFFAWYVDPLQLYPDNAAGLVASYVAALPFLFNSLLGDLFFCGILFSAYNWYVSRQGVIA